MVDLIMFLKKIFSMSGVVTGGTTENGFFFFNFVVFMKFLDVCEVFSLAIESLFTYRALSLATLSQFVILYIADIF